MAIEKRFPELSFLTGMPWPVSQRSNARYSFTLASREGNTALVVGYISKSAQMARLTRPSNTTAAAKAIRELRFIICSGTDANGAAMCESPLESPFGRTSAAIGKMNPVLYEFFEAFIFAGFGRTQQLKAAVFGGVGRKEKGVIPGIGPHAAR